MKKFGIILLVLLCLLQVVALPARADETSTSCNTLHAGRALAEETYTGTANAVILFERNTQTLVYAHHPDVSVNPTGLTKLLTSLIVLEEGNLGDVVTVKRSTLNSVSPGSVSAGLKAGEEITLRDLLYCVMVSSANDAAAVMAEHVAGSQSAFVDKMNARAATLGCVNTHFTNVHGLKDDRQRSTARELAIITEEALKNEQFRQLFAVTHYTVPATNLSEPRKLTTTNYMMDESRPYFDARVTGGKPAAATTTDRSIICTAKTEGAEYLCVVISAKARTSGGAVTRFTNFDEASKLLTFGFEGFSVQQVMGTEQPFGLYAVADGVNDVVISPDQAVFALLPTEFDAEKLRFEDVRNEQALRAPLSAGTSVGILQIYYDSILIGQVHLLARHAVAAVDASVHTPGASNSDASSIGQILKWFVLVLLLVLVTGTAVLFALRRANSSRYHKSNHRKPRNTEGREV